MNSFLCVRQMVFFSNSVFPRLLSLYCKKKISLFPIYSCQSGLMDFLFCGSLSVDITVDFFVAYCSGIGWWEPLQPGLCDPFFSTPPPSFYLNSNELT